MLKQFFLPVICGTIAAVLLLIPVQPCMPAYAEEGEAECWAVIVGVSEYKYYDTEIPYADEDAKQLFDLLSPVWGQDHMKLLIDSEATQGDIRAAITGWLKDNVGTNDTVLFYFSGMCEADKDYLAPYNARYEGTWIASDELSGWLEKLDCKGIAVVLQASFTGRFEAELSGNGRVVLMCSRSDEYSWHNSSFQHSIFSYYILEALNDFEAADSDNNLELSVEEIFNYAQPKTTDWLEGKQHPLISDGYAGQLSLLLKVTADVKPDMAKGINILSIAGKTYSSGDLPVSLIWAPGSIYDLEAVSSVSGGDGIRHEFKSWDDGNSSASRTVSHGGAYTANYKTYYHLAIESDFGEPKGEGWYDSGSRATISVASIEEATVKRIFTGWSGDFTSDSATASLTMDSPKEIRANWRTDYLLTIESDYGGPEGAGWYESDSAVNISVTPVEGIIIRQVFTGWSGDFTSDSAMASLTMDSPKAIRANWRTDYTQLYILIAGIMVLAGAITITIMLVRTRRRKL